MRSPREWKAVDWVAVILALALTGLVWLILIATTIQILDTGVGPEVELSENATQILIAAISAVAGLLGGYVGGSRRRDDT